MFHEHLEEFNLINMNGRVYDPLLARFLNADPLLQDNTDGQNYNRYSYVLNNPTKYTDPSGYAFQGAGPAAAAYDAMIENQRHNSVMGQEQQYQDFKNGISRKYEDIFGRVFGGGGGTSPILGFKSGHGNIFHPLGLRVASHQKKSGVPDFSGQWSAGSTAAIQASFGDASPYYQNQGKYTGSNNWYNNNDIDLANNINTAHGIATGIVGGGYGFSSSNVYKYAQQFGSRLASASALTKLNGINAISMANVLGRANIITGVIGATYSLGRYGTDKINGREGRAKDLADGLIGLGGTGVGVAATLGMISNPIGWGVGIGVGIYFGIRFVYDLNHP